MPLPVTCAMRYNIVVYPSGLLYEIDDLVKTFILNNHSYYVNYNNVNVLFLYSNKLSIG